MELILAGLMLLLAAAGLYRVSRANSALLRTVRATGITPIAEVLTLHQQVAAEVGSGLFRQRIAVQGTLECEQPLLSDLGNVQCAACFYRVMRRWEEPFEERDKKGHVRRGTRSGQDRVAGNERRTPFWVRDASGRLLVIPEGASLDTETTVDRFQPGGENSLITLGNISVELGRPFGVGRHRRTIGYHFHEEVLPLGRTIYVLGEVTDHGESLAIRRSHEPGMPFLVSLKPREGVIASARQMTAYTRYGSYAGAVLGLLLLIAGILQHKT